MDARLAEFREIAKEVVRSACRTALLDAGFTPDDYFYQGVETSAQGRSQWRVQKIVLGANGVSGLCPKRGCRGRAPAGGSGGLRHSEAGVLVHSV